jgi:hypothetical protein
VVTVRPQDVAVVSHGRRRTRLVAMPSGYQRDCQALEKGS